MSPNKSAVKVAIYARRSQDEKSADMEDKSTTRQLGNARAFAQEKGWTVVGEYVDEARSGRNVGRLTERARLAADAEAGKFSIVIARNVDRLSRDDREGAAFIYQLDSAGVEAWEYSGKQKIDVSTPQHRLMLNMRFTFAAQEAEAASSRTSEQKTDRMKQARLNDGRVLGYENFGEAKKRERRIHPQEAKLVRRIFSMAAAGKGILKIAKELNAEKVPNPTGQLRNFGDGPAPKNAKELKTSWAQTGIRAILANTLYIGQQIYGKTAWCWGDGECSKLGATLKSGLAPTCPTTEDGRKLKHKYLVPESRWMRVERPELRIVDQELWDAAQERLARSRELFLSRANGQLNGRPKVESGLESKYLLSGFLVCASCGGRMMIVKRTSKRGRPTTYYVCSTHRTRGGACSVKASLNAAEAHERIIRLFLNEVLTPAKLKEAVDSLVKRGSEAEVVAAQKAPLVAELARLERELANLTAALASGQRPEVVLNAIAEREAAKKKAAREVADLEKRERAARDFDAGAAEKKMRAELKTWRALLERDPAHGRAVLRQTLQGPIEAEYSERTGWWFAGVATLGGITGKIMDVPVSKAAADEIERLGLTPERLGALVHEQLAAMKAKRLAGGSDGPAVNVGATGTSDVHRPMCPRGDSNTRHAV